MDITINGESLDLSAGFSIEIEETNPIFNDYGSQSIPATIPPTRKNNRILAFPTRIDAGVDPNNPKHAAVVSDGVYMRSGIVNVTEAGQKEGISFNVGFDNSTAYAQWSAKKLSELSNLPMFIPSGGSVDTLLEELYTIYHHSESQADDLAVFPIAINKESTETDGKTSTYWEILNRVGSSGLHQPTSITRLIDGELTEVDVPAGYMVSPFLRVWRILGLIFEDLGLTLEGNPFRESLDLSRLVVLNNAADSCCRGEIRYADLMPDCTVSDFLNSLWVRFGLVYNINYNTNSVRLMLLKDILHSRESYTIDDYIAGTGKIIYNAAQYVKLSAKSSIEGAAPSHERFEDFARGLNLSDVKRGNPHDYWRAEEDGYYDTEAPSTFMCLEVETHKWFKLDFINEQIQEMSTSFFNWDPQPEGLAAFELSSEDEWIPVTRVISDTFDAKIPAYLFGSRHYHSYIIGSEASENSDKDSTPLAFMFAYNVGGKTIGRLSPESSSGKPVVLDDGSSPSISLLFQFKDGLFNTFWADYDEILRHGTRSVEIAAVFKKIDILHLDVLNPVRLGNIRCLIDTASYSLPAGKNIPVNLKLRTIQPQGSYDLTQEQNVPDFSIGDKHLAWEFLSGTYGEALDTLNVRKEAVQLFMDGTEYQPHGEQGDYYYVDETCLAFKSISPVGSTWEQDDFGVAYMDGAKTTRSYRAIIVYSVYEKHEIWDEQIGGERTELSETPLGEVPIEVSYQITMITRWIPD